MLCYDYNIGNNGITIINLYRSPRNSLEEFNYIIDDIKLIIDKNDNNLIILAGDFNLSTQPTKNYPNGYPGAENIFNRISSLGFINCTMEKYRKHIKTVNYIEYQNDYIFVNSNLNKYVVNIGKFSQWNISDHFGIYCTIKI